MRVAIDAGHGSNTAGKRTPDGYREHYINVMAANACAGYLQKRGIEVVKTGWDDEDATDDPDIGLTTRQKQVRTSKCDLSVSFHANASGDGKGYNSAAGVETFFHIIGARSKDSQKLAALVQKHLVKGTPQRDRGTKPGNLAMCNALAMETKASVLCEIGFMTNREEALLMMSEAFCREQGQDAARGVLEYLGIQDTPETSEKPEPVPKEIKVRINIDDLNIRKGPGTDYPKTGRYTGRGVFTIIEKIEAGKGSKAGWGKLKSGAGWISMDFCEIYK